MPKRRRGFWDSAQGRGGRWEGKSTKWEQWWSKIWINCILIWGSSSDTSFHFPKQSFGSFALFWVLTLEEYYKVLEKSQHIKYMSYLQGEFDPYNPEQAKATPAHWLLVPNITPLVDIYNSSVAFKCHGYIRVFPDDDPEPGHSHLDFERRTTRGLASRKQLTWLR